MGDFAVFLEGGLRKVRVLVWSFAGEFVVNRVINVDRRHHVAWGLKTCHSFEIYFHVGCGKESGKGHFGNSPPKDRRVFAF
jgi:hypothetical protein